MGVKAELEQQIMNIPEKSREIYHASRMAEIDAYKRGHRDARHAAAELVAAAAVPHEGPQENVRVLHLFAVTVAACGNDEGPFTFDIEKVTCMACRMAGAASRRDAAAPVGPQGVEMSVLPYERIDDKLLTGAVRLYEGEHLLVLQPFGWHLDGKHIPNAAEQLSREYICEEHRWEVVADYGPYIAIVKSATPGDPSAAPRERQQ